ncbi:hypothetical protein L6R50_22600 [Myxococcota bacterium]|nr:hypothetical protein [Myxococcota bacterium]
MEHYESQERREPPGFQDVLDEVRQTATDLGHAAVRTAREQPLVAVAGAAAIGFALGGGFINRLGGKLVLAGLQAALAQTARDRILGRWGGDDAERGPATS